MIACKRQKEQAGLMNDDVMDVEWRFVCCYIMVDDRPGDMRL